MFRVLFSRDDPPIPPYYPSKTRIYCSLRVYSGVTLPALARTQPGPGSAPPACHKLTTSHDVALARTTQFWLGGQMEMARCAVWSRSLLRWINRPWPIQIYPPGSRRLIYTVIYMSDRLLIQAKPNLRLPPLPELCSMFHRCPGTR